MAVVRAAFEAYVAFFILNLITVCIEAVLIICIFAKYREKCRPQDTWKLIRVRVPFLRPYKIHFSKQIL